MGRLWICGWIMACGASAFATVNPWPTADSASTLNAPPAAVSPQGPVRIGVIQQSQPVQQNQQTNPALAALQQMLGGGRSEFAGGNNMGLNNNAGTGSSLELNGPGGTGLGGVQLQNVNACSEQPGKFNFKYGDYPSAGCDGSLKMHEDMSNFINNQMGRCVNQAAGMNAFNKGKIYHAGTLGDARHQTTGSLHNYGLAIDVKAIEIDGRVFRYSDKSPATQAFFTKLRQCWGEAAQRERAGCLPNRSSGMPHGSIGDENHDHHNHLHLSLPMCRSVAGNAYMALLELLMGTAHAAEIAVNESNYSRPPNKLSEVKVKIPSGEVTVSIVDTHGEPVGADHIISLSVKCANGKVPKEKFGKIEACDFIEARYNKKARVVEAVYKVSRMQNGRLSCDKTDIAQAAIRCD